MHLNHYVKTSSFIIMMLFTNLFAEAIQERFMAALQSSDAQGIATILTTTQYTLANQKDASDNTPLHIAANNGDLATVRILVKNGADIGARNKKEQTPYDLAKEQNKQDVVDYLKMVETFANSIILKQDLKTVKAALSALAKKYKNDIPYLINAKDRNGQTLFHIAVANNKVAIVKELGKHGADINAHDFETGASPLHFAFTEPDTLPVVRYLIKQGARISHKDKMGNTPLHKAAQQGSIVMALLLISNKANIESTNNAGQTPRDVAVASRKGPMISFLTYVSDLKKDILNNDHTAVSDTLARLAKLCTIKTVVNLPFDDKGNTFLHHAAEVGNENIARTLINYGAQLDAKNNKGKTPFQVAKKNKKEKVVQILKSETAA